LDGGDAAEHVGEQDIQNGAKSERSENSDRHVALRIPRFLCGRGNGIKADVSEEDNAGGTKNSEYSAIRVGNSLGGGVTRRHGNHRCVIGRINESPADTDEEQDDAKSTRLNSSHVSISY